MSLEYSKENEARIEKLLTRYPNGMAACLPLLHLAQEQFGWVSEDAMRLVARRLDLPLSHVYGVATFYTMYNKKKVGTYHVQVCTNVSCTLCGATDVLGRLEKKLGVRAGETTADGLFTLTEVECLATCGAAPAVQVNDEIHELQSPDKVDELIDLLRERGRTAPKKP
jgi:NADH-quinone oxidoreductase subunit E